MKFKTSKLWQPEWLEWAFNGTQVILISLYLIILLNNENSSYKTHAHILVID